MTSSVTHNEVVAAAERISGVAVRTPLVRSDTLDALTGARMFLKAENLQRTGSFKFRGAYNRLSAIPLDQRRAGVVAFSSGNHAQGVALAAKLLGMPATIVMPSDAPAIKVERTRGHGAEVVFYDRLTEDRDAIATAIAAGRGAVVVPPFNDRHVIAGQGTAGLEAVTDLAAMGVAADLALVCCGGGGLASGFAVGSQLPVIAVEPQNWDDVTRSLAGDAIVPVADALRRAADAADVGADIRDAALAWRRRPCRQRGRSRARGCLCLSRTEAGGRAGRFGGAGGGAGGADRPCRQDRAGGAVGRQRRGGGVCRLPGGGWLNVAGFGLRPAGSRSGG